MSMQSGPRAATAPAGWLVGGSSAVARRPAEIALLYLALIGGAEAVLQRSSGIGLAIHAVILVALLIHGTVSQSVALRGVLWTLALAPLLRIEALTLPLAGVPLLIAIVIAAVPALIAAIAAAWALRLSPGQIGLRLALPWLPVALIMLPLGLTVGVLEYGLSRPRPLAPSLAPTDAWLPALVLLLATGLVEELIYRGLIQSMAARLLGGVGGVLFAAAVFTILQLGYGTVEQVGIVFVAGLLFGIVALRSGSILGPALAHAGINIGLFVIAPYILPVGAPASIQISRPAPLAPTSVPRELPAGSPVTVASPIAISSPATGASPIAVSSPIPAPTPEAVAPSPPPATLLPAVTPVPSTGSTAPPSTETTVSPKFVPPAQAGRQARPDGPGRIALSDDGVTWTERNGPTDEPVLRIIVSYHDRNELHVLTPSGYFVSIDAGRGWSMVRGVDPGEALVDLVLSHTRNVVVVHGSTSPLQIAETGEPFDFPNVSPPVTDILAVAPDRQQDRFYAYDDLGRTFVSDGSGSMTLHEAAPLPADLHPEARGLTADGTTAGELRIDGADGAVWISRDGFESDAGYVEIR